MKSCVFMLEGTVPSKKNQRRTFYKYGRVINIPSKQYEDWHEMCERQLKVLKIPSMNPPYEITLCFWMKDNRRTDLDNKQSSILDLLQDCEIIKDDSWQDLPIIKCKAMGISKDCPRVKIEILSETDKPGDYVLPTAEDRY